MKIELEFIFLAGTFIGVLMAIIGIIDMKQIIRDELSKPLWIHITLQDEARDRFTTGDGIFSLSLSRGNQKELLHHVLTRHPEINQVLKDHASYNDSIKKLMDDIND